MRIMIFACRPTKTFHDHIRRSLIPDLFFPSALEAAVSFIAHAFIVYTPLIGSTDQKYYKYYLK